MVVGEECSRRVRAFKRWMNSTGLAVSEGLQIMDSGNEGGIWVRAKGSLREGDLVATIPKRACLTLKTTAASHIISSAKLDGYLALSAAIMFERSLGDRSPWAPYFRLLPYNQSLPLLWSPLDLDALLLGTELHKTVKEDIALINEDWEENILPLLEVEPFKLDPSFFRLQDYFAAKTLIASRSFEVDDYHGFGMVPLADLFNHKTAAEDVHITSVSPHSQSENEAESGTDTEGDEREDKPSSQISPIDNSELEFSLSEKALNDSDAEQSMNWEDDSDSLEIIMIKDVKAGDEVYNTYGMLGNAALLHRYGFTEPDNPFDIVNIDMELVVQWSSALFSSRFCRSRISLWKKLGYSDCVGQESEYFEISFNGEPQMELMVLLYIMFLSDESYRTLDFAASTSGNTEDILKGDISIFLSKGASKKITSDTWMNKNVGRALLSLADMRDGLYGTKSLEDDTEELKQCCPVNDKKLYHSLMLRISERSILKKLRSFCRNNKQKSTRKKLRSLK